MLIHRNGLLLPREWADVNFSAEADCLLVRQLREAAAAGPSLEATTYWIVSCLAMDDAHLSKKPGS